MNLIDNTTHDPFFRQLTGTIPKKTTGGKNEQVLDKLKVERERGITGQIGGVKQIIPRIDLFFWFSKGSDSQVINSGICENF